MSSFAPLSLAAADMSADQITVFLLSLAVLLGLARLLGEMARQFGQPAVLGEILAGVLLGPTVFDYVSPDFYAALFPETGGAAVGLIAFTVVAVCFLLLVAGLEVDLSSVWRQGRVAASVSVAGMAFPFALGAGAAWMAPQALGMEPSAEPLPFAMFIGIAMSITALPVIAKILMDLNMFKSDLGMLVMSAAMVNDLLGWLGFALILAVITGAGGGDTAFAFGGTLVFVALMLTLGRAIIHRALPYIQAHSSWPGGMLGFVLTVALLCAALTEWIGVHAIFGAFIAGIAIGDSHHLRERTRDTIGQFVTNIFAPIFFASIGLRINFIEAFDLKLVAIVLAIAIAGKVLGCYFGATWAGMSKREGWAVGFGMSARGAMEIILAQLALAAGLIGEALFVAIVIMALATSLMAGPLMQWTLRSPQQRRLRQFLGENRIVLDTAARTDEGAIRELSGRAAKVLNFEEPGEIAHAVMQRERIMHTGLPGGVAVPHARLEMLKQPCVIIGRYEHGVDFDAPDGSNAHFICLLLTPDAHPETQIELLDLVVRAFSNDALQHELMDVRTPTEFLAALNRFDSAERQE